MAYNHKKRLNKKAEAAPQNREQALQEYNKDWGHTLPESIPNYNGLLGETRGEGTPDPDETIEALMDQPRKEATDADGRTTEGQLDKRESYIPHRDAKHYDQSPMPPINALSGAADAKYQKAFAEASKGGERRCLDKDPGSQMDGPKTKVVKNVPESGSQLQNHPSRFASGARSRMILATLRDADRVLFDIYYRAAVENRELTAQEKRIEAQITSDKKAVLANFGQMDPNVDPNGVHPAPAGEAPPGGMPTTDPNHPVGHVNSEFYPQPSADPLGEPEGEVAIDDALIEQMLGGTPPGGIGGEDLASPDFANIHQQEQQEIEFDPLEDDQPRF